MSDSAPDNHEPTARILVVEDSLGVARSLSLALGLYREGLFRSETCPSAEEALERLHATHFDLVISDLRLPGMDGLALLERSRQISPETRGILITAFGSPEVAQRAAQLANAYLAKPFLLQDLVRLAEQGSFQDLGTSNPPQSPVAWSNFVTGMNPGGHGIFDFVHRVPATYHPISSATPMAMNARIAATLRMANQNSNSPKFFTPSRLIAVKNSMNANAAIGTGIAGQTVASSPAAPTASAAISTRSGLRPCRM